MKVSKGASLDRYYLFKLFGFGVFIHKIHHSDPEGLYHSHPWNGVSLILGKYKEYFQDDANCVLYRHWVQGAPKDGHHPRYLINFIRGSRHHRVVVSRPTWTLFFHLRKSNQWSIVNRKGEVISDEPWEGDTGYKDYEKAVA